MYVFKSCVTSIETSLVILAYLLANLMVEHVSSMNCTFDQMFVNITVLLLPPIESRKKLLSLDWRLGTWFFSSAKEFITFSK